MGKNKEGTPDIAIVGGGITGAFTAYFLARLGVPATLIERDLIGAHASGKNPGGLNPMHGAGIPGPMHKVTLEAFRLHLDNWESIQEASGIDFSPRLAARLHLAMDDRDIEGLASTKQVYDATRGFAARWVEANELAAIEPGLDPAVRRGLWTEGNAKVDSAAYTRAVASAAAGLGATSLTAEVRGLRHDGPRVTGVTLDTGTLSCGGVVIASGAWCAEPSRWLGVPIPVEPVRGEMLLVEASRGVQTDLAWRDAAAYGTGGSEVWLGGTEDRVGLDAAPSDSGRASILERAARLLPEMRRARVLRHMAALRPVTPDGIPIVGLAPGWENASLALGSGRKGVLLSAAIGRAAADLLTVGKTEVPIGPCTPERCFTLTANAA
jgi:glycine oxidase